MGKSPSSKTYDRNHPRPRHHRGKCVRLTQGDSHVRKTVYGDDPVEVARRFADAGLRRLHVVDLTGESAAYH